MGLINSIKKEIKKAIVKEQENDMLQYYQKIKTDIKPLENVMVSFAVALKEKHTVEDKIELLKALIESFYELKSKCILLGDEYKKYFSDMWEHIHNSESGDFCYIDRYEKELSFLLENKDELIAKETLFIEKSKNLKELVFDIILRESPILQTDIYKMFDPIVEKEIASILYYMAKNDEIKRTKKGKTYIIESV